MTVREAFAIQLITGNHSLVVTMQTELALSKRKTAPESVLASVLKVGKESGDVMAAVQDALADGKVTDKEKTLISREIQEEIEALEALRESINSHGKDLGISTH